MIILAPEKFSYIINRFSSFFDPSKNEYSQSQKAIEAIKQGRIKGQGYGRRNIERVGSKLIQII